MRSFTAITVLFIAILGGGLYLTATYEPESTVTIDTPETEATMPATEQTAVAPVPPQGSAEAPTMTETKPAASQPTPTARAQSSCTQGGTCTQAQVATHNTRQDCYVSMSHTGKVYDITAYVKQNSVQHPGGDIADYCGQDISVTFVGADGSHRHSGSAMQDLTAYEFATLQ